MDLYFRMADSEREIRSTNGIDQRSRYERGGSLRKLDPYGGFEDCIRCRHTFTWKLNGKKDAMTLMKGIWILQMMRR